MSVKQEFELREKAFEAYTTSLIAQSKIDNPDKHMWWHIDNVMQQLAPQMPKSNKRWLKWLKLSR